MGLESLTADDPAEIGGYRLRARLGAGGMGRVYLAFTPGEAGSLPWLASGEKRAGR